MKIASLLTLWNLFSIIVSGITENVEERTEKISKCSKRRTKIFLGVGESISFHSENYPKAFKGKTTCKWTIKTSSQNTLVTDCKKKFRLRSCKSNSLTFSFSGKKDRYCGTRRPLNLETGSKVNIVFKAKKAKNDKRIVGFYCTTKVVPPTTSPPPVTTEATTLPSTSPPPVTTEATALPSTSPLPVTTEATVIPSTSPPPVTTEATTLPSTTTFITMDVASDSCKFGARGVRLYEERMPLATGPLPVTTEATVLPNTSPPPVTTEATALPSTSPLPVTTEATAIPSISTLPATTTTVTGQRCKKGVMVCYYGSWAVYRPIGGKIEMEGIDPNVCTHIIYSFAGVDWNTYEIKVLDEWNDLCDNWGLCGYDRFTALKLGNPELKVLLAVGGYNEGSAKFSLMSSDASKRSAFIQSAVTLLLAHNFDGLDMDWEYPTLRDGSPNDKANFVTLLSELRTALDVHNLLLTAAVGAGKPTVDSAYDIPGISQHLDFIHLMTYDFHGTWDAYTHHVSPLYAHPQDTGDVAYFNDDFAVQFFISQGAPPEKLVLGIPLYGYCYKLSSANDFGVYAPASGEGLTGPYTQQAGYLGYNELCDIIKSNDWIVVNDTDLHEPYAYNLNSLVWCSFENPASVTLKAKYAANKGLAGCMVWSIDTDDFWPTCHSRSFEMVKTMDEAFNGICT